MMPPMLMILRLRTRRGRAVRLWLPLFLLWLLVLPLLLVALPIVLVACAAMRINPFLWIAIVWRLLNAVCGTHIEIDTPRAFVFMHVY